MGLRDRLRRAERHTPPAAKPVGLLEQLEAAYPARLEQFLGGIPESLRGRIHARLAGMGPFAPGVLDYRFGHVCGVCGHVRPSYYGGAAPTAAPACPECGGAMAFVGGFRPGEPEEVTGGAA